MDRSPLADELPAIRRLFPATERTAYLLNAGASPPPAPVVGAMREHLEEISRQGCVDYLSWLRAVERCRGKLAVLLGCKPEEVAFTKNTSQGLQLAAASIPWEPGDNVVINDMEFPANVFPWHQLARTRQVQVRTVASSGGRVPLDALASAIDSRTRAISISWVQFSNGFRTDLAAVSSLCEERGLYLVIDLVQGAGALELNLARLGRRTLAAGGCHKWMLCPPGIGYFYCPAGLLEELRPAGWGWLSMTEPFAMRREPALRPDAARFEEGNHNIAGIYGLDAALDIIQGARIERIEAHVLWLTERLIEGLLERGYRVLTPRGRGERSGIVLFSHPTQAATAIRQHLQRQGVITVERDGAVRASPHLYNSAGEIDWLLAALPRAS